MSLRRAFSAKSKVAQLKDEQPGNKSSRRSTLTKSIALKLEAHYGKPDRYWDLPETSIKTHKVVALMQTLKLPLQTPMLTTKVAHLPRPLIRGSMSEVPQKFCSTHTWLEPTYITHIFELVAQELHYRSDGLYRFPKRNLNIETRTILYDTLASYRDTFRPKTADDAKIKIIKTPLDAFSEQEDRECLACELGALLRDEDAVQGLASLCKGRKKHHYTWPELLCYLEPIEIGTDDGWRRRWLREGDQVRKNRRAVNIWRQCGGGDQEQVENPFQDGEEIPIVNPDEEQFPAEHREGHARMSGITAICVAKSLQVDGFEDSDGEDDDIPAYYSAKPDCPSTASQVKMPMSGEGSQAGCQAMDSLNGIRCSGAMF